MLGRLAGRMTGALAPLALAVLAALSAPAVAAPNWAQAHSDLPPSQAVRFGVLPNGMRYAVMRNQTPPGMLAVRLRIDAGSLHESDAQTGMAHLLEHMAFRGSTHVESGEALRMLERLGLSPGADANASTEFTQTVYKFNIPSADAAKLDTALMLMRETASELTLTDASFAAEKQVVLSEERLGAGPARDLANAGLTLQFAGQRAAQRLPIGRADVLRVAPVTELRAFYRAYYRPERATLIVAGDIDPDAVEARIRARFADWRNPTPAPSDPDYGTPARQGQAARVVVEPGVSPALVVSWQRPYDRSRHDKARLRRTLVDGLAMNILSRRLFGIAAAPNAPFVTAGASSQNGLRSAHLTTLQALIKPDQWQRALQALIIAQRQISGRDGVSRADLDVAIAGMRATFQTRAASLSTRASTVLADEMVMTVDLDDVFTSDVDDVPIFEQLVRQITPGEVNAAARTAFSGAGPYVLLASPIAVPGGEQAVLAAAADAQRMSTSSIVVAARAWPYTSFGTPGAVGERSRVDDLDITRVRFANGVRLNVKPTALVKDQVGIAIRFGGGRMALPADRPIDWAIAGWFGGGLKALSIAEMQQVFAGKVHNEVAVVGDDAFLVNASTRSQDFDLEMQLLTAYMTAPAWRSEAFDRVRAILAGALPQLQSTPTGVLRRDMPRLLHNGDRRWSAPTPADVAATHVEDIRAVLEPALLAGQMEVTIVGDITVDRAIAAAAATFGTLPPRTVPARPASRESFPAATATPVVLRHGGRADQGMALAAWPTADFYADPDRARIVDLLSRVISQRLFDQVRVAQGASYATGARAEASTVFPNYGGLIAFAETPPEQMGTFETTLAAIIADLQSKDVTADELDRARTPVLEGIATAKRANGVWLASINGSQAEPRQLDALRTAEKGLQKVTPADLKRAAIQYLAPTRAYRLRILPTASAAATPPAK